MSFLRSVGYQFSNPSDAEVDGGIILASKVAKPVLDRRIDGLEDDYPHLNRRLLDPQLYLSRLEPEAQKACMKLASYPWFDANGLDEYDSQKLTQKEWKDQAQADIRKVWPGKEPSSDSSITKCVASCIEYQLQLGVSEIILPAPLTSDASSYSDELSWLDAGLEYIDDNDIETPVLATIAIQDICLRYQSPSQNQLINTIADSVSAREVDGAYIVLEQSSEDSATRHCGSSNTLWSILSLVHQLARDAGITVGVNYLGAFGLACRAAGAAFWSSGWYKSLYRLRIADIKGKGRAYPRYWTFPAAIDIHLRSDLDRLANGNLVGTGPLDDVTPASEGLITALSQNRKVSDVADWVYRTSNVTAARDHYYHSVLKQERELGGRSATDMAQEIDEWLSEASKLTSNIVQTIGGQPETNLNHVQPWCDAFKSYRNQYGV
jgi:hypothetical protein